MKAQSDTKPNRLIRSRGKTQVAHNIKPIVVEDMDGESRTAWEYDYVEIEGRVTRSKILAAIQAQELEEEDEVETDAKVEVIETERIKNTTKRQRQIVKS